MVTRIAINIITITIAIIGMFVIVIIILDYYDSTITLILVDYSINSSYCDSYYHYSNYSNSISIVMSMDSYVNSSRRLCNYFV